MSTLPPAVALSVAAILFTGSAGYTQSGFGALPRTVVDPPDNPSTPKKVALGRLLFWDPVLSGGKDVACATCHRPENGYSDNRAVSLGVRTAKRNSLTVLQALEPIKSSEEMRGDNILPGGPVAGVVARLTAIPEYRQRFARAFGGAEPVTGGGGNITWPRRSRPLNDRSWPRTRPSIVTCAAIAPR